MALFCIILALYGIYCLIEETESEKEESAREYREKELQELRMLRKEVAESSYLVQLSSCESFGLSVCESLILGTPVIITDLPVFNEIGCNESNSIKLDLNMLNVDVDKIVKGLEPFKYTPPKSNWNKYLNNNSTYSPNEKVYVKVIKKYTDIELKEKLDRFAISGKLIPMTKLRASILEAKGLVEW